MSRFVFIILLLCACAAGLHAELSDLPQTNSMPSVPEKKLPAVQEYMIRPQFEYRMTGKAVQEYDMRLNKLMYDRHFLAQYPITRQDGVFLTRLEREKLTYTMGQYYLYNDEDLKIGKPRFSPGTSILNTLYRTLFLNLPLITMPFQTPYERAYEAEQSFRYYIKKYPQGLYAAPALFSIGQCRVHQKDYLEAVIAYEYGIRILLEQNNITNTLLAQSLAQQVLPYASEYRAISFTVLFPTSNAGFLDSKVEFCRTNGNLMLSVGYSILR